MSLRFLAAEKFAGKIEKGQIKVDENLRVEGTTNIFAAGDVTTIVSASQYSPLCSYHLINPSISPFGLQHCTGPYSTSSEGTA